MLIFVCGVVDWRQTDERFEQNYSKYSTKLDYNLLNLK
jgi:hypothetical protein